MTIIRLRDLDGVAVYLGIQLALANPEAAKTFAEHVEYRHRLLVRAHRREAQQEKRGDQLREAAIARIINATAAYYLLSADDIKRDRRRLFAEPRQIAMYLCRQMTELSLKHIGRHFDDHDHSTVVHAIRTIERRMDVDPVLRSSIEEIQAMSTPSTELGRDLLQPNILRVG